MSEGNIQLRRSGPLTRMENQRLDVLEAPSRMESRMEKSRCLYRRTK